MINFTAVMQGIGNGVDVFGVMIILLGLVVTTLYFIKHLIHCGIHAAYDNYRQSVGRVILLGLEFLVAGDIIRTVAVAPTLVGIAVLAGIVIIRTFLSMALQLEIDGKWPWQKSSSIVNKE